MKKQTKLIVAAAVAVVIIASVIAVGFFNNRGDIAEPSTGTTEPQTTMPVVTQSETWFDWDAYVSSMNLTESDPTATAALSDIVSSVDPSATIPVSGAAAEVPTSIVYVIVNDPSSLQQYLPGASVQDSQNAQPQPTQPQLTETKAPAMTEKPTESNEMVDYQYTLNSSTGTVKLDKYVGSEKNPRIPEMVNGHKVDTVGDNCFKGKSIESIYISKNIKAIGNSAFSGCKSLKNVWFIGTQEVTIGNYCFEDCTALQRVILSVNTTSIGDGCFANCKSLKKIYIPDTVKNFGVNPFSGCADGFTIECDKGSIAHQTAQKYEIHCEAK